MRGGDAAGGEDVRGSLWWDRAGGYVMGEGGEGFRDEAGEASARIQSVTAGVGSLEDERGDRGEVRGV